MAITPADVKRLRDETGAGVMDVKKALEEANGDFAAATKLLRAQGQKIVAKKQDRVANEGWVGTYTHATGKIGSMVAVSCESDFVARSDPFQQLVKQIAMHVAAADPQYLSPADVPADVVAREEEAYRAEAATSGKPEKVVDTIVKGKLEKFYAQTCLLRQPFIMDEDLTVEGLVHQAIQKIGEKIEVTRFVRYGLS